MVRIAQGLVHLGKGTLTLNPFHSDRTLMSPVAVAGIISVLVAMLDVKESYSQFVMFGRIQSAATCILKNSQTNFGASIWN